MQLRTKCPHCQKALRCPPDLAGAAVRCPQCQEKFRVKSLASGSSASIESQPSMEAEETLDTSMLKVNDSTASSRSGRRAKQSRDGNVSRPSSISSGGQQRAKVNAEPSLGRLGDYDLKEVLGKGGFGTVYRAWDESLGRQVAIKIPHFDVSLERKVKRFRLEARAAAKLQHPNIVGIIAEGMENDKPYIVSEFVDGHPLSQTIETQRSDYRQSARWVRELASALHYAHQQGVIHRDVKPDNVMLDQLGRPRLMDFGLAKQLDEDSSLSIDGSVLGTPGYMSPEQARGETDLVDGRSDQYSLGVVLYQLLCGQKPYSGPPHSVLAQVASGSQEPPNPRKIDASIPKDLEAICLKSMSKERDKRYATLAEMSADLGRWLAGKPTQARPVSQHELALRWCRQNPSLAVGAAALSIATVVIVGLLWKLSNRDSVVYDHAVASNAPVDTKEEKESIDIPSVFERNPQAEAIDERTLIDNASVVDRNDLIAAKDEATTVDNSITDPRKDYARSIGVELEFTNSIGMKFALIPPGKFQMGSPESEIDRKDNEFQHEVEMSQHYYLGAFEVTQAQYEQVMGNNPSYFQGDKATVRHPQTGRVVKGGDGSNHPVEKVSWEDAVKFCERLSELPNEKTAGRVYRLPTEAEWEYACRAGSKTAYGFEGNPESLEDHAWFMVNGNRQTHPVGEKKPNAWGLHDMHGNVWEWCSDWYGEYPKVGVTDPVGPKGGASRVYRGGSWINGAAGCRSANRSWISPSSRSFYRGFRVALISK